jgi:hypothetical protein
MPIYLLFTLLFCSIAAADTCPPKVHDQPLTWKNKMRLKALKNFNQFLSWSTSEKLKSFALESPLEEEVFEIDIPEMESFAEHYGYFSSVRPIVGKVSSTQVDLQLVLCLLKALFEKSDDLDYLQLATAEVLSKALAYREMKEGQKIQIPVIVNGKASFEKFTIEHVFNLWHGMPAFGLIPERRGIEPILLFRGTDFSLDSQRGWASLMSDLDLAGPGLRAFQHAKEEIHDWLVKASAAGKKAQVIGFSLGGALAAYTFIYENGWVTKNGSVAFCPPGVAEKVIEDWNLLPIERRQGFTIYVNEGDIIPKVGKLFANVYCLSTKRKLKPLSAHTKLMSADTYFLKARVDVAKENSER